MVASWVPVPPGDWVVLVMQPEAQAEEKVQTLWLRTTALLTVGLLLVVGAGFLLMREVGTPLSQATLVASRIAKGELFFRHSPGAPVLFADALGA